MKILFVQKVKAIAGSEKYFFELIPKLENRGIKTKFVCIYLKKDKIKTQEFIEIYSKLGLKIHSLEVKSDCSLSKILKFISKVYQQGDFDLVHSHLIHADFWCALLKASRKIKVPLVSTKHGYDEDYTSVHGFSAENIELSPYYLICRFSEKFIDSSFAVSAGLKNLFIESKISKKSRIRTIHHGFDLPEIKHIKNSNFRFAEKQLVILGRVIPFKGHHLLIEALKAIKEKSPDFVLLIIGHGDEDYINSLKLKISEYGLKENVKFLGFKSNIYDYLLNSDIMLVPSISEGFGLVFLEALNARIPIIGFDVPATNEIIVNNETGILIKPYDTEEMGLAILELLNNKQTAKKLADNGYQKLIDKFSLERMVNESIDFYNNTLDFFQNKN